MLQKYILCMDRPYDAEYVVFVMCTLLPEDLFQDFILCELQRPSGKSNFVVRQNVIERSRVQTRAGPTEDWITRFVYPAGNGYFLSNQR